MSSVIRRTAMLVGIIALAALALTTCAVAGDYHKGANLLCSDCHIMHASKDGTDYGTGGPTNPAGFGRLLKGGSVNALCLTCHDGDVEAPDVVGSGTAGSPGDTLAQSYTSPFKNSAGYFQKDYLTVASGVGHNLGGANVTAVQGGWAPGRAMECTDCHDAHGTTNYRNLMSLVGDDVTNRPVLGGTSGTQDVYLREAITIPTTQALTTIHYDTTAVAFNTTNTNGVANNPIANWCVGCHTNIASNSSTSPMQKHPQNHAIGSGSSDGANWLAGNGAGFGAAVDTGSTGDRGVPRVRFAQNGTTYATTSAVSATTNREFCLSCHKAHGSQFDSAVLWNHYGTDDAVDRTAGCNQCHAKGT